MQPADRTDWIWGLAIALVAVLVRLIFLAVFPTQPVSDFAILVDFAVAMRDHGFGVTSDWWHYFNPGTSSMLALIFRVVPGDPAVVARFATAVVASQMAWVPFVLWRGVFGLRVRVVAGLLLALWPAQIFFSGVVAQDNWVLLPSVALASLAVRAIVCGRGYPVAAACFWILAAFTRQELLLVLSPMAIAASGVIARRRNILKLALVAGLLLGLMGLQRYRGSGRFAITTHHFGESFLGAMVPDVGGEWRNTAAFLSSVPQASGADDEERRKVSLAMAEFGRRPGHHVVRMLGGMFRAWGLPDRVLYWSLTADRALPSARKEAGARCSSLLGLPLDIWAAACNGAFLAALSYALARRRWPILIVAMSIGLKIGVHTVVVAQGRFFMVVVALELLVIAMALHELDLRAKWKQVFVAWAIGSAAMAGVALLGHRMGWWIQKHDEHDRQLVYRVPIGTGQARLACEVTQGRLTELGDDNLWLKLNRGDPARGDKAAATCVVKDAGPVELQINAYAEDRPRRLERRVTVDDQVIWRNTDQAAFSTTVPLPSLQPGSRVGLEIELVDADGVWTWSPCGRTQLRFHKP